MWWESLKSAYPVRKSTKDNPAVSNQNQDSKIILGHNNAQKVRHPHLVGTKPRTIGLAQRNRKLVKLASYLETVHITANCSVLLRITDFHAILPCITCKYALKTALKVKLRIT